MAYIVEIQSYENKEWSKSNKTNFLMSADTECVTLGKSLDFGCFNFLISTMKALDRNYF